MVPWKGEGRSRLSSRAASVVRNLDVPMKSEKDQLLSDAHAAVKDGGRTACCPARMKRWGVLHVTGWHQFGWLIVEHHGTISWHRAPAKRWDISLN